MSDATDVWKRSNARPTLPDLLAADPRLVQDPYPVYAELRDQDPVHWSEELGAWFVTRYEDVAAGLRSESFSAQRMPVLLDRMGIDRQYRSIMIDRAGAQMINNDPPRHGRLRGLFTDAFRAHSVEELRAHVENLANDLLGRVSRRGRMDLVSEFAEPLPILVMAELVGFPADDIRAVKAWADGIAGFLSSGHTSAEELKAYFESWGAMAAYLDDLARDLGIDSNRLLGELAERQSRGEANADEILANLVLLAVAGHETTTNMIGLGVLTLIRHPDSLRRLAADPSLISSAVEEILRFEPTSQWDFRVATEDVDINGTRIRQGQLVNFVLSAANRDPEQFPNPDRFDITRSPNRHVTFGRGVHLCLGAPLARLELQVALEGLIRRFEDLQLTGEDPEWKPNVRMRGLASLAVAFTPKQLEGPQ